jgi:hypothetical protein
LGNQLRGEQHIITNALWMTVMEASANTTMQVNPYGIPFHIETKVATFLTQKGFIVLVRLDNARPS